MATFTGLVMLKEAPAERPPAALPATLARQIAYTRRLIEQSERTIKQLNEQCARMRERMRKLMPNR